MDLAFFSNGAIQFCPVRYHRPINKNIDMPPEIALLVEYITTDAGISNSISSRTSDSIADFAGVSFNPGKNLFKHR